MTFLTKQRRAAKLAIALTSLVVVAACSGSGGAPGSPSPINSASAAQPPSVNSVGTTTVSFLGFDVNTLTVNVNTLTTSALAASYISAGKVQLQILVDSTGQPVPCGTSGATYVRFDTVGNGGAHPDGNGQTTYALDLDNLEASTGGVVKNVHCGDNICIRAHYVTGGGSPHVDEHFSDSLPYQVVCNLTCTYTQGFWKTHYAASWPAAVVSGGLTLGSVSYTAAELESIFNTAPAGNGLIILAHQLIAAKLNIANGADGSAVAAAIAAADTLIGGLVVPPVGGGSLAPAATAALTTTLDNYNNGLTGPGHCSGS